MKKLIVSLLVIAAFVVAPISLFAATTATTTGSASIVAPISVATSTDLDFGVIANTGGGTVTILAQAGAQNDPSTTGTLAVISTSTPSAATFTVTGTNAATYAFTCPSTLQLSDGASHTMDATIAHNKGAAGNGTSTIASGTTDNIYVGGVLTVGATQVAGSYSADLTVTVAYN